MNTNDRIIVNAFVETFNPIVQPRVTSFSEEEGRFDIKGHFNQKLILRLNPKTVRKASPRDLRNALAKVARTICKDIPVKAGPSVQLNDSGPNANFDLLGNRISVTCYGTANKPRMAVAWK